MEYDTEDYLRLLFLRLNAGWFLGYLMTTEVTMQIVM
jgi:hypothetical protein